ncbi:fimbrillin family protein [Bacteroides sp.]|uniref:fimbrillin family protein n=1 Tax=Bacteroides sp. TaxID=29523 RepID=UPI0025C4823B|nr:fimbrillin family protein [Bacteroides sp.]
MKKTILNLLLFLACMSSCSKNESFEKTEELSNPVTVSFMTNISRVTASSWGNNDPVGISATGTDVMYTNVKYLSDASGKFAVSDGVQPICFKNKNPMSFTAYYPYSDNNGTVSVNTLENNSDCNFIWAKADNVQYSETPTVNLQFDHSMAELRIVVSAQDGASLESFKNMTVSGLKHDGNFTTADGKAAVLADAQVKDWDISLTEANGKLEFKGYVLPQAISDLSIRVNSASHNITFDNNSFEAGLYYTINVTVNSDNTVNVETTIFGTTINGQFDASKAKIGYIDVDAVSSDDDMAASKAWFVKQYPYGEVLSLSESSNWNLSQFSVIWIHIDILGLVHGYQNLTTDALINSNAVSKLTAYLKDGGNLLLCNHATQLLVPLNRLSDSMAPNMFGSGAGAENRDVWGTNANINNMYDRNSHEIYNGLSYGNFTYGHKIYPLLGNGIKEDHNCVWSFSYSSIGGNRILDFENENKAVILGVWQHVTTDENASIIEFNPTETIKGRCIAVGIGAYEWHQNNVENPYQGNIEKMTQNAIEYLDAKWYERVNSRN